MRFRARRAAECGLCKRGLYAREARDLSVEGGWPSFRKSADFGVLGESVGVLRARCVQSDVSIERGSRCMTYNIAGFFDKGFFFSFSNKSLFEMMSLQFR